jgi:hypothetical protein
VILALDCPTWAELAREPLPVDGPYAVRPSRMGYVAVVVDTRTQRVRATGSEGEMQVRADELNRREG